MLPFSMLYFGYLLFSKLIGYLLVIIIIIIKPNLLVICYFAPTNSSSGFVIAFVKVKMYIFMIWDTIISGGML